MKRSGRDPRGVTRNRGDLFIWTVVAVALGALALGFLTRSQWTALAMEQSTGDYNARREVLNHFVDRLDDESRTVEAYFVPSHDIFGNPNPVPASGAASPQAGPAFVPGVGAANPPSHEFDEAFKDASGKPHFLAYVYDSAKQTLSLYPYSFRDASKLAVGVSANPIGIYSNVVWFSPSDLLNSQVPLVDPFVKQVYTNRGGVGTDHLYNLGFPEVVGGDKGLQLYIATSNTNKSLALGLTLKPHTNPRSENVSVIVAPLHAKPGDVTISFVNPTWPAQPIQVTSPNYRGTYTPQAGNCSGIIAPLAAEKADSNGAANWVVQPLTPGSCTLAIATSDPTETSMLTVTVGNYQPLITNPAKLAFVNPEDANPVGYDSNGISLGVDSSRVVSATEAKDLSPLSQTNNCGSIAGIATGSSTQGAVSIVVTPNSPGDCIVTFSDGHGGSAQTAVHVGQFSPLVVLPTTVSGKPGDSKSVSVSEANYSRALNVNLNDCAGYASVNGSSPSGWAQLGSGPSSSFTVSLLSPTASSCSILVSDDHNNSGGSPAGPVPISIAVASPTAWVLQIQGPASSSLGVGGSATTFVASAPVTAGSSGPLPVGVTSVSGPCSVSPGGWQTSGTTFTVTPSATTAGNCTVTVAANGTAANSPAQLAFTVSPMGGPTVTGSATSTNWDWVPFQCTDVDTKGRCVGTGFGNFWESGSSTGFVDFLATLNPDANHPIVVTTSLNIGALPNSNGVRVTVDNPPTYGTGSFATWNGAAFIFSSGTGPGIYKIAIGNTESPSNAPPTTATCTGIMPPGKQANATCSAPGGFTYVISQQ